MKLFNSKYYPTLMFLLILSILMIILFNIGDILEKKTNNEPIQNSPISGFVTQKITSNSSEIANLEKPLTSLTTFIFYSVLIGFFSLSLYILIKFIYRR